MDERPSSTPPGGEDAEAFVADVLRRKPRAQFSKVMAQWRARHGRPPDPGEEDQLRAAYERQWQARHDAPAPSLEDERRQRWLDGQVLLGVALTPLLHLVVLAAVYAVVTLTCGIEGAFSACDTVSGLAMSMLFFVGVAQLLYVGPVAYLAHSTGRRGISQGLIIGGAVTFLLNAACFGLLFAIGLGTFFG